MGLRSRLKEAALGVSQRALERLLSDDGRAQKVAEAVGAVQGVKARLDAGQAAVMHQLNLATRGDFREVSRSLSAMKKRLQALDQRLQRARTPVSREGGSSSLTA
jgi:hypothetical protein